MFQCLDTYKNLRYRMLTIFIHLLFMFVTCLLHRYGERNKYLFYGTRCRSYEAFADNFFLLEYLCVLEITRNISKSDLSIISEVDYC